MKWHMGGSFLNHSEQLYNYYTHSLVLLTDNNLGARYCDRDFRYSIIQSKIFAIGSTNN